MSREKDLLAVQAAYREWLASNPEMLNDQSGTAKEELRLIKLIQTHIEKNKPKSE